MISVLYVLPYAAALLLAGWYSMYFLFWLIEHWNMYQIERRRRDWDA